MLRPACVPPRWIDLPPWQLSGVVIGAALNDPATLAALGPAVDAAPYRGAPRAPVLYVKPRHTLAVPAAPMAVPRGEAALEVGATIGLVIGRSACRVDADEARQCIAGHALVVDLGLPLASWYRPSARARALDGSCRIGRVVPARAGDGVELRVSVDGVIAQRARTARFLRSPEGLVADVSEFMTLRPGDVLLLGVPHGAPHVRAGQRVRVEAEGFDAIEFDLEAAP
jgi:5-oxopent-3-ene-1,2,5-tricarboxylate decarboxylase/2-hydroxyhepta-2,4-diene-1,7-dioate isomerase